MIDEKNMDANIHPGDDFYRFVNGNWMKNNPVPEEYSSYGSFHVLHEENQEKLKTLFEEISNKGNKTKTESKISLFYQLGMDEKKIESEGIEPILYYLNNIGSIKLHEEVFKHIGYLHSKGVRPFFGLFADQDEKNSEMVIAQLCQGGLGMPDRDYYLKNEENFELIQGKYKKLIEDIFVILGYSSLDSRDAASKIYNFEKDLAAFSMNRVDMRDPHKTYNKKTYAELKNAFPKLNWDEYLLGLSIAGFKEVNVRQVDFFKSLEEKIINTKLEDIKLYLKWVFVRSIGNYLNAELEEVLFDFYGKTLSGSTKLHERWKRVISVVNDALGEAIGEIYVQKYFPPIAKEKINTLVEALRVALAERIEDLSWMQEGTKTKALDKLSSMKLKVGYPNKWINYEKLEIKGDTYIENVLRSKNFEINRELSKIDKPADPEEWHMYPQTVNAYYNPTMNEIVFPAAILQPPFFDYKASDDVNFGGIGTVIGHEMTHGFDDKGSLYDKKGNLNNWWDVEDEKNFQEETKKLVELYNKYEPIEGAFINGNLTLGENIADLGGLTLSLHALKNQLNSIGQKDIKDVMKRFFFSYANIWKQNMRNEELLKRLIVDVHSPAEYRVNGIVYHIKEFYKCFNIDTSTKLYRKENERIKIW